MSSLCRAKFFYEIPLFFLIPEISETVKVSFTKFFGTVRQNICDGRLWYRLLCINFFDTPNCLKHWSDAQETFRHCETKNFGRKNVTPPIIMKIFRYSKFSETLKECTRKIVALWDQKIPLEERDIPLFIHKFFRKQKFSN